MFEIALLFLTATYSSIIMWLVYCCAFLFSVCNRSCLQNCKGRTLSASSQLLKIIHYSTTFKSCSQPVLTAATLTYNCVGWRDDRMEVGDDRYGMGMEDEMGCDLQWWERVPCRLGYRVIQILSASSQLLKNYTLQHYIQILFTACSYCSNTACSYCSNTYLQLCRTEGVGMKGDSGWKEWRGWQ